jgi:hypothetical protein
MISAQKFGCILATSLMMGARPAMAEQSRLDEGTAVTAAITEASERFVIPTDWIRAVIAVESGGNARAVSPAGAIGLMQIMPATWSPLRLRYHLGADPYDVHDNILAGTALLRELYDRFGAHGFLAAYNAGPSRYLAFSTAGQPLRAETEHYLSKLAPLLGGELGNVILAPVITHDWRSAPLFVSAWSATPISVPTAHQASDPGAASTSSSRLAPRNAGIFATLSLNLSP